MMINNILVPVDGSKSSTQAVKFAAELAAKFGALVKLVTVIPDTCCRRDIKSVIEEQRHRAHPDTDILTLYENALIESGNARAEEILKTASELARTTGASEVSFQPLEGDPAEAILEEIETGPYDLVVMGKRGMGKLKTLLLGSVSQKVSTHSPLTVIMVAPPN